MRRKGMKMTVANAISDPIVQVIASFACSSVIFSHFARAIMSQNLTAGSFTVVFSSMLL